MGAGRLESLDGAFTSRNGKLQWSGIGATFPTPMRRPLRSIRLVRSLTALITVWCLGCSAFDPLVAGLFPGDGPLMVCAGEGSGAVQSAAQDHASVGDSTAKRHASDRTDCGCGSCSAPAPTGLAIAALAQSVPHQLTADVVAPPSVARTPLVPPPQLAA